MWTDERGHLPLVVRSGTMEGTGLGPTPWGGRARWDLERGTARAGDIRTMSACLDRLVVEVQSSTGSG